MPAIARPHIPYNTLTPFEQRLQGEYDRAHLKDGVTAMIAYLAPVKKSDHVIVTDGKARYVETKFLIVPDGQNPYQAIDTLNRHSMPVVMAFDLKSKKSLYEQFDIWGIGDIADGSSFHKRPAIYLPPRESYETKYETAARIQTERRASRPTLRLAASNGMTLDF